MKPNPFVCLASAVFLFPFSANAQQAPKFSGEPFSSEKQKSNFCELSERIVDGQIDLKYALEGLSLTVGVIDHSNPSFLNLHEENNNSIDSDDPGLFAVLLDELARRARFSWRDSFGLIYPPHHEINQGRMVNGNPVTWTDILLDTIDRYDFSFAEWVHNMSRRNLGVGFPLGWYDASTIIIQRSQHQKPKFNVSSFLNPFSLAVWGLILAVILFSALVFWQMDMVVHDTKRAFSAVDVFLPAMEFAQHQVGWERKSHAQRLFAFSLSFWALIIGTYSKTNNPFQILRVRTHNSYAFKNKIKRPHTRQTSLPFWSPTRSQLLGILPLKMPRERG